MSPSERVPALFRPRRAGSLTALARAVSWHRRKLAVLAALAAVLCTIAALSPAEAPTVPVVVAAHDLAGGRTLTSTDLRIARFPVGLAPAHALSDPAPIAGRMLITPAGAGSPLSERAVVAPRGFAPGVGRAMVPVRLDDPAVAGLLRVGDLIDVLAASGEGAPARTIAAGARVLAFPASETGDGPFGAGVGSASGRLVLLEVSTGEATELIQAQSRDRLGVILR